MMTQSLDSCYIHTILTDGVSNSHSLLFLPISDCLIPSHSISPLSVTTSTPYLPIPTQPALSSGLGGTMHATDGVC